MFRIAPSILAADFGHLADSLRMVEEAGADYIHIDVMDGHYVPNISMGLPVIESIRPYSQLPFDVHLMIQNPGLYASSFIKAGANMLSFHIEVEPHAHRLVHHIQEQGAQAGIVLNPSTPISLLEEILADVDYVLLMTVNPGFGGQTFIPSSLSKISRLKRTIQENGFKTLIEIDGGVDLSNYQGIVQAGTDILVAGSVIFRNPDPSGVVKSMIEFRDTMRHV
jgi:ribulose-phosphate 3-epimerase